MVDSGPIPPMIPAIFIRGILSRAAPRRSPAARALEARGMGPAALKTRAVPEGHDVFAVERGPQLLHAIDVDDGRSMDADEALRIEPPLHAGHRAPYEVSVAARVQREVVARGFEDRKSVV